jgi:hypothetical protein
MNVRAAAALWAVGGVTVIIGGAIVRILPHALEALRLGLNPAQWVIVSVWSAGMLVGEGYRGFQKQFAPRVAARLWRLLQHGTAIDMVLAPFYCIGYYRATRRRMIISWSLTTAIVGLIVIVRLLSQPWRGIIDIGVVLGLVYGLFCTYVFIGLTISRRPPLADPEIGREMPTPGK